MKNDQLSYTFSQHLDFELEETLDPQIKHRLFRFLLNKIFLPENQIYQIAKKLEEIGKNELETN